jgi:hypothetical protein
VPAPGIWNQLEVLDGQRSEPVGEQNKQEGRADERNETACADATTRIGQVLPRPDEEFSSNLRARRPHVEPSDNRALREEGYELRGA